MMKWINQEGATDGGSFFFFSSTIDIYSLPQEERNMDLFTLAVRREERMQDLYQKLAERAENASIRDLLLDLSASEAKHDERSENLKALWDPQSPKINADGALTLRELALRRDFFDTHVSHHELYSRVRNYEEECQKFYDALATKSEDESVRQAAHKLAEEKRSYIEILRQILEMSKFPDTLRQSS
jgi:rubrerythrin